MNDTVSRKALIERLREVKDEHYNARNDGDFIDRYANAAVSDHFGIIIDEIESGEFSAESEGEAICTQDNLCPACTETSLKGWKLIAEETQAENERLRDALNGIMNGNWAITHDQQGLAIWSTDRINPFSIKQEVLALSPTSETEVRPSNEQAEQVRQLYEAWSTMKGTPTFSAQTIANVIADVAIIVGIDIPGINPNDPFNIPGIKDGRE